MQWETAQNKVGSAVGRSDWHARKQVFHSDVRPACLRAGRDRGSLS